MTMSSGGYAAREAGQAQVLLVEDNARDVRLMREVMRELKMECGLQVAADGAQALAMLRRQGQYASMALPDLVLLDINLPVLSGIDVLREVKADPELRLLPVLMLTTSHADSDVHACYALNANSYLVKPADFDEFTRMVAMIQGFWLERATPAPRRRFPRTASTASL
jgi:chemotaxis family two-component system response regulator Rcp1